MDRPRGASERVFLATTAIEEFWDTSMPMVFLGEGCRRYSRRSFWEPLGGQVIEDVWSDRQRVYEAAAYLDGLYEKSLTGLTDAMNAMRGVSHDRRYWRIVLGPWLQIYIHALYDRYQALCRALERYPELITAVLAPDVSVTPSDTLEFVQLLKEDSYNLFLYSRIFRLLGKRFPEKKFDITAPKFLFQETGNKETLKKLISRGMLVAGKAAGKDRLIVLRNSYFTNAVEAQICLKTFGRVWPLKTRNFEQPNRESDLLLRARLRDVCAGKDEFERLLFEMLSEDMPIAFVEGFEDVMDVAKSDYPARPKAIFSGNAWYFDEPFKQWAASSAESGSALLGMQHGGNYGSLLYHPSENHELAITDCYFSWGWKRTDSYAKVLPRPAAKLSGRRPIGANNSKEGILFTATSSTRYLFQLPFTPVAFNDYLVWQARFIKAFPSHLTAMLRVRLHREDFGWDMAERWKALCPEAAIESWDIPFNESLDACRLYVCDHLATTFTEALSADKPTILFWDPAITELRAGAQPYYDRLYEAGILFYSPEEAAGAVSACYADIEGWWNKPQRQEARQFFCERFAWTSKDAVDRWIDEFKLMAKGDMKTIIKPVDV